MFVKFIRENVYASFMLTILRIFIGWQWLNAGWSKITSGKFDASGFITDAIGKVTGEHPSVQSWWADFLGMFALPNVGIFNILVPWGEFLVGLGLLLGTFTTFAVLMGVLMNFSYMFSGATSTNPQMVLIEIFILVAGFNAGRIGLDHWIIPFLRKQILRKKEQEITMHSA
ncbi:DoxX family membrane protein [Peribacillus sp. NJ4]|uniref:DoxX family membrane protein n=1 Tax=unclassified Peribacillus TaxID=2675266 RepID=UPI0025A0D237|nr:MULTISPECIES: DoxX family membrane protein [unclassified Peribacillus]MDM5215086.1 DoxX family membrane protein [Peribacillus sp. NJ4]MDM5224373.1 DoxX family membrane protein [Peribacillus sp. NJ11]